MFRKLYGSLFNRVFHLLARQLPGATNLRPAIHRWRGVKIGRNVFIGDDVYLENEYPECIEIQDGVQISIRAIILAHTRGPGRVVLEKDAYVGPNTVIVTSAGKTLRVGEGAVIGAGSVITHDVPARIFIGPPSAKAIARVTIPLSKADSLEQFIRGLAPLKARRAPRPAIAAHVNNGEAPDGTHAELREEHHE